MKNRLVSSIFFVLIIAALYGFQLLIGPANNTAQASSERQVNRSAPSGPAVAGTPYYGFTAFPYDATPAAIRETQSIIENNSDLYAIHLDECLPWREMLNNEPFPGYKQEDWDGIRSAIPNGHKVYVALAFLGTDRETLAPTCGREKDQFDSLPSPLRSTSFRDQDVKRAYLNYVRKAIRQFNPDFLNIGIELEGIAHRFPSRWRQFEDMFFYIRNIIKKENPKIQLGISLGLQPLLDPDVAARVKAVVEGSDYFGLSFYPYASSFHEKLGAPALKKGAASWLGPLEWARNFTNKPIAIAETGYTTQDIYVRKYDLRMKGSVQGQADYVRDLLKISKRDDYMFVVWFLAVDYDKLYQKMPQNDETEINLLWRNIGLFDGNVRAKPAWKVWQQYKTLGKDEARTPSTRRAYKTTTNSAPTPAPVYRQKKQKAVPSSGIKLGFARKDELPACAPGTDVSISSSEAPGRGMSSMQWNYPGTGDWQWCIKQINKGRVEGANKLDFWVRSDTERQFFITIKEDGGEAYTRNLSTTTEWARKSIRLDSLSADSGERQDGKLETNRITSIVIADPTSEGDNRTLWMSDLTFTRPGNSKSAPRAGAVRLGFSSSKDLFDCGPGSTARFDNKHDKSMRWKIQYNGDWQWCLKRLAKGKLAGTQKLRFRIRSNRTGPVFVNLTEAGGEAFYAIINTEATWKIVELRLDSLSIDNDKRRNGKIEPDELVEIMFADPEGTNRKGGKRKIWLSDLEFM